MAYTDIAEMAADDDLRRRLYACVSTKNVDNGAMWVDRWVWLLVAGDDAWSAAWSFAGQLAAVSSPTDGTEPATEMRRGWDSAVITDQMILDRVNAVWENKGAI